MSLPGRAAMGPQVLVIYDERIDLPGLAALDSGLATTLKTGSRPPVEIYREAMDLSRFDSETYRDQFASHLGSKYAGRRIDVVVAVMGPALDFLVERGELLFPGTPVVFCGIDRRELGARKIPERFTGVLLKREFAPTLEIALALQPDTRDVVVVGGASSFDQRLLAQAREELGAFETRVRISYLTDQPMPELLTTISRLPPRTVVLFLTLFRDAAGSPFVPHEALERVAAASSVPVYGFLDQYLGRGIVGGWLYSLKTHGEAAARQALRILEGVPVAELSPVEPTSSTATFDARALERWHLPESRLPAGAEVRFRAPSLWRDHRRAVLGIASASGIQLLLVAVVLLQFTRRKRAESGLRESEHRFRMVADTTPVLLWLSDPEGRLSFVNRSWLEFAGSRADEEIGRRWIDRVHPDDRSELIQLREESSVAGSEVSVECRIRRHDGDFIPFLVSKRPRFDVAGQFLGFVGSGVDLSAQKAAARETQRGRIELARVARVAAMGELTASVSHELRQPLAAILANAHAAQLLLAVEPPPLGEVGEILDDIRADDRRAAEILERIRSLVENREPQRTQLDLNETAAEVLRLLKLEASERRVTLRFEPAEDLPAVSGDRVPLQQVLVNLVLNAIEAMSGAPAAQRWIAVRTARRGGGSVEIQVADSGTGIPEELVPRLFEPFWTTKEKGLGMGLPISRSIVESHNGRIWIEREPGGGARFHVELPAIQPSTG